MLEFSGSSPSTDSIHADGLNCEANVIHTHPPTHTSLYMSSHTKFTADIMDFHAHSNLIDCFISYTIVIVRVSSDGIGFPKFIDCWEVGM